VLELLQDDSKSYKVIAQLTGATESQINTLAKKNGLTRRPGKKS
jgi:hypothetical protein